MRKFIAAVGFVLAACGGSDEGGATLADKVRVMVVGRDGRTVSEVPEVSTDAEGNLVIQGTQGEQGAIGPQGPQGPSVPHVGYMDASGAEVKDLFFMAPLTVAHDKGQSVFFVVDTLTGKFGGNPDPSATFFTSNDCSGERLARWDVRNLAIEVNGQLHKQGAPMTVEQTKSLDCFQMTSGGACSACVIPLKVAAPLDPVQAPNALSARFPVILGIVQ